MTFNVEYVKYITYYVEADSLDEAINKADELRGDDDEAHYSQLNYVSWEDDSGNYHDQSYYF